MPLALNQHPTVSLLPILSPASVCRDSPTGGVCTPSFVNMRSNAILCREQTPCAVLMSTNASACPVSTGLVSTRLLLTSKLMSTNARASLGGQARIAQETQTSVPQVHACTVACAPKRLPTRTRADAITFGKAITAKRLCDAQLRKLPHAWTLIRHVLFRTDRLISSVSVIGAT